MTVQIRLPRAGLYRNMTEWYDVSKLLVESERNHVKKGEKKNGKNLRDRGYSRGTGPL